jgi:hypothetical protein
MVKMIATTSELKPHTLSDKPRNTDDLGSRRSQLINLSLMKPVVTGNQIYVIYLDYNCYPNPRL